MDEESKKRIVIIGCNANIYKSDLIKAMNAKVQVLETTKMQEELELKEKLMQEMYERTIIPEEQISDTSMRKTQKNKFETPKFYNKFTHGKGRNR